MIDKIITQLSSLTILEIVELANKLEKKWNISINTSSSLSTDSKSTSKSVDKSDYDIYLKSVGAKRIKIISMIREIIGSGLKEAKNKIDSAPVTIKTSVPKKEAYDIKKKLELEGAKIELK